MKYEMIDPYDREALHEASLTLERAQKRALQLGEEVLSDVFGQWAFAATFGDVINRIGGPETLALAREYLEKNGS